MFTKEEIEDIFSQLRVEWGYVSKSEWGKLVRDTHLGIARAEAGVPFGDIDSRVMAIIEKRVEPDPLTPEDLLKVQRHTPSSGRKMNSE